jgi:hypothetical protein
VTQFTIRTRSGAAELTYVVAIRRSGSHTLIAIPTQSKACHLSGRSLANDYSLSQCVYTQLFRSRGVRSEVRRGKRVPCLRGGFLGRSARP